MAAIFISIAVLALAAGFFIPVLVSFLQTGRVDKIPTLIVCGFTVIAALLSFFTGLQLQNAVQKNKQDFELERLKVNWRYRKILEKEND